MLTMRRFVVLCVGLVLLPQVLHAQPVLNEIFARPGIFEFVSGGTLYGDDYIEIRNTNTTTQINISGYSLTDNTNTPRKYIFPNPTAIPANGTIIIFCDGETNFPRHADISLNAVGETVFLYAPNGSTIVDRITFGLQIEDHSIGRMAPGTNTSSWALNIPTPGQPNITASVVTAITPGLLIFNEWAATNKNNDPDWFEIYNRTNMPVLLSGLVISDVANPSLSAYPPVPPLSFIAANGWADFESGGKPPPANEVDFSLSSTSGETLRLYGTNRTTLIHSVTFPGNNTIANYWTGDISYGYLPDGNTNRLVQFVEGKTTRGDSNFIGITNVVVNEILTHTDVPLEDAIELHNPTASPVDISYWWISNQKNVPEKFQIPAGTIIPAGGYKVFYEYQFDPNDLGFTLNSAHGDEVWLYTADAAGPGHLTGGRRGVTFPASENGVSFGRWVTSTGDPDIVPMRRMTLGTSVVRTDPPTQLPVFRTGTGATNDTYPLFGPLVISEVHYRPPPTILQVTNVIDDDTNEFVEIFNPTGTNVPLYDLAFPTNTWHLRGAADFDFPRNLVLPPNEYIVLVNFAPTNSTLSNIFVSRYNVAAGTRIYGPYGNKLDNGGGDVRLERPDVPQTRPPDEGFVPYLFVDAVNYNDKAPWPTNADGRGASLNRLFAAGFGNDPTNWVAGAPTPGRVYTPNSGPVFPALTNRTVPEGRLITIPLNVFDAEVPPQTLTYTLNPGAPSNITISNGIFRWRPTEAQGGPGLFYPLIIRVSDSATPSLTATQSFTITVEEVNQPPTFNVRDQHVRVGETLSFPTAFDYDLPPQNLDFDFVGDFPTGMNIDNLTGVVTWAPTAPGTNQVTIRCIDGGTPSRSATNTFTIKVYPSDSVLGLADLSYGGNIRNVKWQAIVGRRYRVSYAESFNPPINWIELYEDAATEPEMSVLDIGGTGTRFYKVEPLP